MTKKRILITGAAGFLGSHLCDRFIREGFHVIGMDNLITGRMANIEHLLPSQTSSFIDKTYLNSYTYPVNYTIFFILHPQQVQ
jgi:dTDP-glucose 4,6-dehydratase